MKREQVLPHVMANMAARIAKGADEYGEPLTTGNGRDALVDAYEEALDLAMYLKQAIMERDAATPRQWYGCDKDGNPVSPFTPGNATHVRSPVMANDAVKRTTDDDAPEEDLAAAGRYCADHWPGPDWSRAPDWAVAWAMDDTPSRPRCAFWHSQEPTHPVPGYNSWMAGDHESAPTFGYTGDWRDSLRKRPE